MSTEIRAEIPISDLTLSEAAAHVDDDSWWWDTMPPILHHFHQIDVDGYWQLTVREHRLLVDYLVSSGLVKEVTGGKESEAAGS